MEKGTKSIKDLTNKNQIIISDYIKNPSMTIKAEIFKLVENYNVDNYKISKKLKTLICLSLIQNNKSITINKINGKKYLINLEWLEEYEYKKINSLIKENNEIKNYFKNNNNLSYNEIFESIDKFSISNKQLLIEIDKNILSKYNNISFGAKSDTLQLIDKKIKRYK